MTTLASNVEPEHHLADQHVVDEPLVNLQQFEVPQVRHIDKPVLQFSPTNFGMGQDISPGAIAYDQLEQVLDANQVALGVGEAGVMAYVANNGAGPISTVKEALKRDAGLRELLNTFRKSGSSDPKAVLTTLKAILQGGRVKGGVIAKLVTAVNARADRVWWANRQKAAQQK